MNLLNKYLMPVFIIALLLNANFVHAQEKSVSEQEKIVQLGKVWGLVKYFHPAVVKGEADWEKDLLEYVPKIQKAVTVGEFNAQIGNMINELPSYELKLGEDMTRDQAHSFILNNKIEELENYRFLKYSNVYIHNLNFDWIKENNILNDENKKKLLDIIASMEPHLHYNMEINDPLSHNPHYNEKRYDHLKEVDLSYRLLALYRFWNLIAYYTPYPSLINNKWGQVLNKYATLFLHADDREKYHLAVLKLVRELDDPQSEVNSEVLKKYFGKYKVPVEVDAAKGNLYVKRVLSDQFEPDLEAGDEILKLNDQPVIDLYKKYKEYFPVETAVTMVLHQHDKEGETNMLIKREEEEISVSVLKNMPDLPFPYVETDSVELCRMIDDKTGYIRIYELEGSEDFASCAKQVKGADNIIYDLRGAIKSHDLDLILGHYIKEPRGVYFSREVKYFTPGVTALAMVKLQPVKGYNHRKFVVLIDENTRNQSENLALKFEVTGKATFIGRKTKGMAGRMISLYLPDGIKIGFTAQDGVAKKNGKPLQKEGIIPDVTVPLTEEEVREGKDVVLEEALKYFGEKQ